MKTESRIYSNPGLPSHVAKVASVADCAKQLKLNIEVCLKVFLKGCLCADMYLYS